MIMIQMKMLKGTVCCLLASAVLLGCSSKYKPIETFTSSQEESREIREVQLEQSQTGQTQPGQSESEQPDQGQERQQEGRGSETGAKDPYGRGSRIEEQTFDVTLNPLGQVTFASYRPDESRDPLADAVFTIEKGGQVVSQLPGTSEDNVGDELFEQVEAVSFLDYNNDGYDDIIIILRYCFGAGPQSGQPHSMIRYYKGSASGNFIYEKEMSEAGSQALAVVTIESAKGFLGVKDGKSGPESGKMLEPWQQAYIDYLNRESDMAGQEGYTLILMSNDEMPQLVEVGNSEANGCRIIHYGNGKAYVTQLSRLGFDYIPGGNLLRNADGLMDNYYDLIYSIVDGEMKLVASGYYGRDNNTAMEFDAEGNPVYQYEWNGAQMSREEYDRELAKVYDTSKAVTYDYSNLYSADEVWKAIEEY